MRWLNNQLTTIMFYVFVEFVSKQRIFDILKTVWTSSNHFSKYVSYCILVLWLTLEHDQALLQNICVCCLAMQRLEITLISTFFSCHKVKNHVEETYSTVKQSNSFKFENESKEHTRSSDNRHRNEFYERDGCFIQDARLNLWFTVAVAFSYVMCALLGPLMRKAGLRFFRLFFM